MDDHVSDAGSCATDGSSTDARQSQDLPVFVPPVAPWAEGCDGALFCELCLVSPSAAAPYAASHPKFALCGGKWPWRRYSRMQFLEDWQNETGADAASGPAFSHSIGDPVRVPDPSRRICSICQNVYNCLGLGSREKIIRSVCGCGWALGFGWVVVCPNGFGLVVEWGMATRTMRP